MESECIERIERLEFGRVVPDPIVARHLSRKGDHTLSGHRWHRTTATGATLRRPNDPNTPKNHEDTFADFHSAFAPNYRANRQRTIGSILRSTATERNRGRHVPVR